MSPVPHLSSLLAGLLIPLALAGCNGKEGAKVEATTAATPEPAKPAPEPGMKEYATPPGKKPVSALFQATSRGNIEAVNALLQDPKNDPNEALDDGLTALHVAAGDGKVDIVKALLEKGADSNAKQAAGATPLHIVSATGHVEIATLLLDNKADVNAGDKKGQTPLMVAASNGMLDIVSLLIQRGASLDLPSKQGATALHAAVLSKAKNVVEMLLAGGAKANVVDVQKYSPLHYAARNGSKEIAELLVQNGCDVNLMSVEGGTAFQMAVFAKNEDVGKYLHALEIAAGGPASKPQTTPVQPPTQALAKPRKKKE